MKKLILSIVLLAIPLLFVCTRPVFAQTNSNEYNSATVLKVQSVSEESGYQVNDITIKVTSGSLSGKILDVSDTQTNTKSPYYYAPGDQILFTYTVGSHGTITAYITDFDRRGQLIFLMLLFFALILLVCRKQGIFALIGMSLSVLIVVGFMIPHIDAGGDPFIFSIIAAAIIIPLTYSLAHGIHRKTLVAIFASYITLLVTIILAFIFLAFAHLSTIIPTDEMNYLQQTSSAVDLRDIFLAGFVIGTVAILNDITVSQASIVRSLYYANKTLSIHQLSAHAMSVGRDHIASLVNTLILVYIGINLPLVITTFDPSQPVLFDINGQPIALEIIRTFSASIGIVLAVPITTYIAALVYKHGILKNIHVPSFLQFTHEDDL